MKNRSPKLMDLLSDVRVGKRLLILVLAFLLWGLVGSLLAFKALREVQINGPLYERLVQGKDLVADILPPPKYIVEANLVAHQLFLADNPGAIADLEGRLHKLKDEYDDRQAYWAKADLEDGLRKALVLDSDAPAQRFFKTAFESYLPALKAGDRAGATTQLASMQRDYEEHRYAIDAAVKLADQRNQAVESDARDTLFREILTWMGVAGVMSVVVFALSYAIARSITRPLGETVEAVRAIAAGDLTRSIPAGRGDEIGQLLATMADMQDKLRALVGDIQGDSRQLARAAQELNAAAAHSADASEAQSEAAAGMAASVEEMSVSIDHVGANAREAQSMARRSGEESRTGGGIVHTAAGEMQAIAESVKNSAGTIRELEGHVGEISAIVGVIREIADQTNLLALNAAIEAARAGEQGRGFAVVADEVRRLAERTGESTGQIGTMIDKVQDGTRQVVAAMEAGVARVDEGTQTARRAGDSIQGIQESAARVVEVVQDIATALKEQSTASQEIAKGVERIAQMSEQNSAAVKQTAGSARQLQELAANLDRSASRFRT
jgi:methyl-accepting chemotaxis protein